MKKYDKEKAREQREKKAAAMGAVSVKQTPTGIVANSPAEWRREYKRMKRREAGATPRIELAAKAKANREAKAAEKALKQANTPHDAHVSRYVYMLAIRAKAAKRYAENTESERERIARYKQKLPDSYVISNLKASGIPREVITPELIGLKREAMDARRLAISIKRAIKNHWKEEHETITKHP